MHLGGTHRGRDERQEAYQEAAGDDSPSQNKGIKPRGNFLLNGLALFPSVDRLAGKLQRADSVPPPRSSVMATNSESPRLPLGLDSATHEQQQTQRLWRRRHLRQSGGGLAPTEEDTYDPSEDESYSDELVSALDGALTDWLGSAERSRRRCECLLEEGPINEFFWKREGTVWHMMSACLVGEVFEVQGRVSAVEGGTVER